MGSQLLQFALLKEFRNEVHNAAVEKIFYDDARALFGKGITPKLITIPEYRSLAGTGSDGASPSQGIRGRNAAR